MVVVMVVVVVGSGAINMHYSLLPRLMIDKLRGGYDTH